MVVFLALSVIMGVIIALNYSKSKLSELTQISLDVDQLKKEISVRKSLEELNYQIGRIEHG